VRVETERHLAEAREHFRAKLVNLLRWARDT
jgi:hypothetical protein